MYFANRRDAERRLRARLEHLRSRSIAVLGLPRGGVPVASEVARALGAPLDVVVVGKLGLPFQRSSCARAPSVRTASTAQRRSHREEVVLGLNRWAQVRLGCESRLAVVTGATQLFEDPGAMQAEALARRAPLSSHW